MEINGSNTKGQTHGESMLREWYRSDVAPARQGKSEGYSDIT